MQSSAIQHYTREATEMLENQMNQAPLDGYTVEELELEVIEID